MNSVPTFNDFVNVINQHDVKGLVARMTPDHVFVDAIGNRVNGIAAMEAAWGGYLGDVSGLLDSHR
jgi:ketosteroid isomerase-like protein